MSALRGFTRSEPRFFLQLFNALTVDSSRSPERTLGVTLQRLATVQKAEKATPCSPRPHAAKTPPPNQPRQKPPVISRSSSLVLLYDTPVTQYCKNENSRKQDTPRGIKGRDDGEDRPTRQDKTWRLQGVRSSTCKVKKHHKLQHITNYIPHSW
ncbi:hypothetical protein KOW79_022175 [Hemibagrus wyckioides]|uniref:Uncharacterized protein n=1 Tax=Hemibagrus wyckioides TaxID=337641 RepID=A0A9D3S8R8_9TELE|nr:hypothetical protein KOW79_022175 [Hemibagrus wyckioides]